jgi:plasmid stabilization system protein ParE
MSKHVLSTDAKLDLGEIWEYISRDSIDAADRWTDRLYEAFESLARTPRMGHARHDLIAGGILFWPVGYYLILYVRRMTASRS